MNMPHDFRGARPVRLAAGLTLILSFVLFLPPQPLHGSGEKERKPLVVAVSGEPGNLDPCMGGPPWTTQVVSACYEMPAGYATEKRGGYTVQTVDDLEGWRPLLAQSIDVGEEGRVLTFHLRRGIRFHPSGNEMTAKDWLWSWRRQLSDPPIGWCAFENREAGITSTEAIEVLDDYTVRITLNHPNPRALAFMRFQMFAILDSEEVQRHATRDDPWATEWLSRNTAGTGPYYIASSEPGDQVTLRANPLYWGEKPFYDTVIIKTVQDVATRLALVQRGDADVVTDIPPSLAERLSGQEGLKVLSLPSGNRTYIGFNVESPPFDDIHLRKAIAYATPYGEIIENVYFGHARPFDSFVLPEIPASTGAGFDFRLDLEAAAAELAQAPPAARGPLSLKINAALSEHGQIAVLLQDYLRRIGVEVRIESLPAGEFTTALYGKELDFFITSGISWIDDPSTIAGLWMETGAYGNYTRFSDPELDRLHDEWRFAPPGSERNEAYRRIQEIYNRQVNVVYLALEDAIVITREAIGGFVLYKDGGIRFQELFREPARTP